MLGTLSHVGNLALAPSLAIALVLNNVWHFFREKQARGLKKQHKALERSSGKRWKFSRAYHSSANRWNGFIPSGKRWIVILFHRFSME
jgi:hypothetical protein